MNDINRPITTRRLMPEQNGPWKTLRDKGIVSYTIEMNEISEKNKIAFQKEEKERLNYLMNIEYEQGRDNRMWPYDLAKRLCLSEDTLQMCRREDHLFNYDRENHQYEYNPENYNHQEFDDYDDDQTLDDYNDYNDDDYNDYNDDDDLQEVDDYYDY